MKLLYHRRMRTGTGFHRLTVVPRWRLTLERLQRFKIGRGYTQRPGKRQAATEKRHAAIADAVRAEHVRGHTKSAIRRVVDRLGASKKTVQRALRKKFRDTN